MNPRDVFNRRLADGEVIVIDGGMGPELARRGVPMHPLAWAAPAALDHADAVRAAHEDYIRAGADVIITNTFIAGWWALEAAGLGERREEVNRRTVELAIEARESAADRPVLVAGALFPGHFGVLDNMMLPRADEEQTALAVREQAAVLAEAGVDLLAFEMVPTGAFGHLALDAVAEIGLPVWVGVSAGTMVMEDGSRFDLPFDPPGDVGEQVRQILDGTKADVMAVTVMHTELEDVDPALDRILPHWSGPLGAYPHHGRHTPGPPHYLPADCPPREYAAIARRWVDRGVQLIGGCCGIGPEHISALREDLPTHIPGGVR